MTETIATGVLGEDIATRFLLKKGYTILERNYRKNHGEIDIIALDLGTVVFVEVKTIKHKNIDRVTRETYRPEFNVDKDKVRVVSRTAELYLLDKNLKNDWRVDLLAVDLLLDPKRAKIRHIKSIYI